MSVESHAVSTYFASPDRTPRERLEKSLAEALNDPVLHVLLDAVHGYLFVVDENRQILAANDELLSALGLTSVHQALGYRAGELMQCEHAKDAPGGCGTSKDCHKCGALLTLLTSQQSDRPVEGECILRLDRGGVTEELTYTVRCSPLLLAGKSVTAVVLLDVTEERRREFMDDLFFHDVNNVLMGLSGYSELLETGGPNEIAQVIISLSNQLNDQVYAHSAMKKAEHGQAVVHPTLLVAHDILHRLHEVFAMHTVVREKHLHVYALSEHGKIFSDRPMLMRVLINLVKNALEASPKGGTVNVTFDRRQGNPVFRVWNVGLIPHEVQAKIYSPGFSTKAAKGRGYGTYSVRLFGEQCLGGRVSFTSSEDAGTTFELELPAISPKSAEAVPA